MVIGDMVTGSKGGVITSRHHGGREGWGPGQGEHDNDHLPSLSLKNEPISDSFATLLPTF